MSLNAHAKNEESLNNNLSFYLKMLGNDWQIKPKVSERKKII